MWGDSWGDGFAAEILCAPGQRAKHVPAARFSRGRRAGRPLLSQNMNEPATERQPDALKCLSADERRSSSKPQVRADKARPNAGAQLQKGITPRSALVAGRNKRRSPWRENREAVVSSPVGRSCIQRWPTSNRPIWGTELLKSKIFPTIPARMGTEPLCNMLLMGTIVRLYTHSCHVATRLSCSASAKRRPRPVIEPGRAQGESRHPDCPPR